MLYKRDLIANLLQQAAGRRIENTEGLNCNWLKKITAVKVCIFLRAWCGHLCCCTCLKSSSIDVGLGHGNVPTQRAAALSRVECKSVRRSHPSWTAPGRLFCDGQPSCDKGASYQVVEGMVSCWPARGSVANTSMEPAGVHNRTATNKLNPYPTLRTILESAETFQ